MKWCGENPGMLQIRGIVVYKLCMDGKSVLWGTRALVATEPRFEMDTTWFKADEIGTEAVKLDARVDACSSSPSS